MRDYFQPKMPGNWSGEAKSFYLTLIEVLDGLHMPIHESWLSDELKSKITGVIDKASKSDYSLEEKDTGIKWHDGRNIYKRTFQFSSTSGSWVDVDVPEMDAAISFEGYSINGDVIRPINCYISSTYNSAACQRASEKFSVRTNGFSGDCTVTVYYVKKVAVENEPVYLLNNGFVSGYSWSANVLKRREYTSYIEATSEYIDKYGYLLIHVSSSGGGLSRNAHFATPAITIPAEATKLCVEAQGANSMPAISFGTTVSSPTDSQTYTGNYQAWITLTSSKKVYSVDLDDSQKGKKLRVVLNARGLSGTRRDARFYKVYFEQE